MNAPSVRINRRAADRVEAGHVWVYASDVISRGHAQPGDTVKVIDPRARPVGTAHYSSTSQISLRFVSRRIEPLDLKARLDAAAAHRQRVVRDSNAYRLVHAEADLLPGLIIDRYGDCYVVQTLSQAMDRAAPAIVEMLKPNAVLLRNDAPVRAKEGLPLETRVAHGEIPERVRISMNGLSLEADLIAGQKTGVYLDQRENYLAAARYANGVVLDGFTSAGGFALHLAPHAERVEAVDSSAAALDLARSNQASNGIANVAFYEADMFDLLASHVQQARRFDTIVLDPPAFTKTRSALEGAARGYKEINLRALRLLTPGGVLVTCSCSHHMSEPHFIEILAEAARDAGRTLRILERRTQSLDHPVLLSVPETQYLKCLILQAL